MQIMNMDLDPGVDDEFSALEGITISLVNTSALNVIVRILGAFSLVGRLVIFFTLISTRGLPNTCVETRALEA